MSTKIVCLEHIWISFSSSAWRQFPFSLIFTHLFFISEMIFLYSPVICKKSLMHLKQINFPLLPGVRLRSKRKRSWKYIRVHMREFSLQLSISLILFLYIGRLWILWPWLEDKALLYILTLFVISYPYQNGFRNNRSPVPSVFNDVPSTTNMWPSDPIILTFFTVSRVFSMDCTISGPIITTNNQYSIS